MFTGIIEGLGTVASVRSSGRGKRLGITSGFPLAGTKIGDSIAVNGACLTAVILDGSRFEVDLSPETVHTTTLGKVKTGQSVNIERALRLSDRLDGHLVSGHVDCVGTIRSLKNLGNVILITISVPVALTRYMIQKGSVAVDGVSLTINDRRSDAFDVSIIPHTAKLTTVGLKRPGDAVNIETDLVGKYIERFVTQPASTAGHDKPGIEELLARSGFR
ncbi:MAG: riboflavin synthase [Deltaproteobacteria bacterium]|nr:riboflavin synthase [Deltaproteobacteria bacterium]